MSIFKQSLLIVLSFLIVGCGLDPQKAPCDYYGTYCGKKVKINQW